MFFFFSEELRRINRAPTPLTANTFDPAWLTDPTNANYVAPALRDPNAVKLLGAVPGAERRRAGRSSSARSPAIQNTRQEVVRVDYDLNPNYRLTGRYTHDNSFTEEPGGLFLGLAVPNVATTDTNVPGQVASAILRSTHRRLEAERAAVPVLEQQDRRHQPERGPQPALVARPQHPRAVPGQRSSA